MRTCIAIAIAVLLTASEAAAQALERFIVVLRGGGQDVGKKVAEVAKSAGATIEADLGDRLVVVGTLAALETLRENAGVKYVQQTGGHAGETMSVAADELRIGVSSGETWTSGDYAYDGAGNIASIGTAQAPGTQGYRVYGYDAVTRLKKAEIGGIAQPATLEYTYDAYGNRTAQGVNGQWTSVPVSDSNNRLTDATYDSRGNQESRGTTAATYDGFGMVTAYEFDGTNAETYVYTAADERIGVLRGSTWTWSIRDGAGKVLRQYRSSATAPTAAWLWIEDFVYREGLLLGSERVAEEGGRRHYHLDHLGSARLVTGVDGSVISEHDFLPFGEERTSIGQHLARGFDRESPMRFTGHERDFDNAQPNDSSSYVDYMHARYYSPKIGRLNSADPMTGNLLQPQSWNRYAYTLNSPVVYIDPYGLKEVPTTGPNRPKWCKETDYCEEVERTGPDTEERLNREREQRGRALRDFQLQMLLLWIMRPRAAGDAMENVKQTICSALPSGKTVGIAGSFGTLGAGLGGSELVLNYDTGQVSVFGYGGMQSGLFGGASGSLTAGYIWGLNGSNSNYSGGFTGGSATIGTFGGWAAAGSDGLAGFPHGSMRPRGPVRAAGMSIGASLFSRFTGGGSLTNYSAPRHIGKHWAQGSDALISLARHMVCR